MLCEGFNIVNKISLSAGGWVLGGWSGGPSVW